jgi:hypothetical protein
MNRARSVFIAMLLMVLSVAPANGATDSDGDRLRDTFENQSGVTSAHDADSDDDGVVDSAEDNDGDRLSNRGEQKFGSHPGVRDSDGDGTPDGKEDADQDKRSNAVEQDHRPIPASLTPRLWTAHADFSPYKSGCMANHGSFRLVKCHYGPAESKTRIVLMGDSHALQVATPIVTVAQENGWRLTTLLKKACPPVLGIHNRAQKWVDDGASCRAWRRDALDWLNADPPDHIILAHSDSYAISTFVGKRITGDARIPVWRKGMKRTLDRMPSSASAIVFGDIPYNRVNPVGCLKKHPKNISKCVTSRKPLKKRTLELALESATKSKGAAFKRFYGKVCSYDPCPIIQGNVLMYRDKGHLTATFAAQLTPTFRTMLTTLIGPAAAKKGKH